MPFLILLILFVSTSYQLFFRYEHWNDRNEPQLVYERDNLTGETHIIHPGDQISFIHRITGKFPPQNYIKDGQSIPQQTLAYNDSQSQHRHHVPSHHTGHLNAPVPLHELSLPPTKASLTPPEPVNALATSAQPIPVPSQSNIHKPPEPENAIALAAHAPAPDSASIAAQSTPHVPHINYQQEKKVDLNLDGQSEKVSLHRAPDGLLDIAIVQGQQEVFYGRGESLQILSHRSHGWSDIALIIPNEANQIFSYNPAKQTYEINPS